MKEKDERRLRKLVQEEVIETLSNKQKQHIIHYLKKPRALKPLQEMEYRLNEQKLLYEGLNITYPVEQTINHLEDLNIDRDRDNIHSSIENETNVIYVKIYFNNTENNDLFHNIKKEMRTYGWQLGGIVDSFQKTYKNITTIIQPNQVIELFFVPLFNTEIDKQFIPNVLFHVTPTPRLIKIKKNGLTPKTNSKLNNHPERIYFFKTYNLQHIKDLIERLFRTEELEYKYKSEYTLLQVDMSVPFTIRLFNDPDSKNSCYTMENIPPNRIIPVKQFSINPNGNIENIKNIKLPKQNV